MCTCFRIRQDYEYVLIQSPWLINIISVTDEEVNYKIEYIVDYEIHYHELSN